MKMEKAINALIRYIDKSVVPQMNSLQQVGYMTLAETLKADVGSLTSFFGSNIFLRMLFSVDADGEINVDRLMTSLRRVISKNGEIEFEVPMYGKFIIKNEDLNEISRFLMEEKNNEVNSQAD